MHRRLGLLLVFPLVFALVACAPAVGGHVPPRAHGTPSASSSAPSTPTAAPVAINSSDYLINGVADPTTDTTGTVSGQWAFFTDSTKRVWCEIWIFSADAPASYCLLVGAGTAARSYAVPAGVSNDCDLSSSLAVDGYGLGLAVQGFPDGVQAGWAGCSNSEFAPTTDLAKTKVLPPGATLTVFEFSCSVAATVATCHYASSAGGGAGTITLGVDVATFSQT